jgi:hypothetical protein
MTQSRPPSGESGGREIRGDPGPLPGQLVLPGMPHPGSETGQLMLPGLDEPGEQAVPGDPELAAVAAELSALDPDGSRMGAAIRGALDMLLDGQHTGRYRWDQLHKTENLVHNCEPACQGADLLGHLEPDGTQGGAPQVSDEMDCRPRIPEP